MEAIKIVYIRWRCIIIHQSDQRYFTAGDNKILVVVIILKLIK